MPSSEKFHYFHPKHGYIGSKPPSKPDSLEYLVWRYSLGDKSRKKGRADNKDNPLSLCHRPASRTINGVIVVGDNFSLQSHEESAENAKPKLNHKQNSKSCPYCSLSLNPKYLERHIYKQHKELELSLKNKANVKPNIKKISNSQSKDKSQLLSCPYCAVRVSQKRFKKHIKKVHPDQNCINTSESYDCADWYECNTVDPIDGSKYLGFERREYENSRFGSFPLHDDYGDESWAD